jgi:hypothetical protein
MVERCWSSDVVIIKCWKSAERSGSRGLGIILGADGSELESGRSTKGTAGARTKGLVAVVVIVGVDSMMVADC